ncbi:MAG: MATE family efflux transporter [Clostridia bacterium]|jgi:putative MATE family efflux protein|nr:MATE family efflux transporter [Clostridia bacterium]
MHVNSEAQRQQMLTEPIGKLLFKKAAPTVLIQLITVIYNTADTYFVAKIDTGASAAVGVVFSLMAIIQATGGSIGMGATSLISPMLGQKRVDDASTVGTSAALMSVIAGALIGALGLVFLRPLVSLIGARGEVIPYAEDYARFILIGAPFMTTAFVLNSVLRSEGQAVYSMIAMISGGILNLFIDPLLIFGFGMGIAGAALATMISQMTSFFIMAIIFLRDRSIVRLRPKYIGKKPSVYLHIVRMGVPTLFRQGMASLSSALLNIMAAPYGAAAVAAISIANKLYMLVRHIVLGIGQGFQPIAGYCFGAKRYSRVKKVFWVATGAATVICLSIALAVYFFREPIMVWFRDDPAVVEAGSAMLRFLCVTIPLLGFSTYVNQLYQSLGFAVGATFLASCRQGIFFVPLVFLLPAAFGLTGIEAVQAAADLLTFVISIPFLIYFFRKHLSAPDAAE